MLARPSSPTAEPLTLASALTQGGFCPVADVRDSDRATDLALRLSSAHLAVVRHVQRVTPDDHTAIATMISQGDFIWGAAVYDQGDPPQAQGLIGHFHISQLDQLLARLIELREACGELG